MKPTQGRKPRTGEAQLRVQWRTGEVSKWTYTADQLVWAQRGWDYDVMAVERAEPPKKQDGAWTPVSGGY